MSFCDRHAPSVPSAATDHRTDTSNSAFNHTTTPSAISNFGEHMLRRVADRAMLAGTAARKPRYERQLVSVPQQHTVHVEGIDLHVWEWPGRGTPLIFAHANGLHGRCWDQVIAHLPDQHCYAVDLRGHGRSSKPEPPYAWRAIGADVAAVARSLDLPRALGVGHSLGGHATAYAASLVPHIFQALLLIEPVILPRAYYAGPPMPEHFAARRRDRWAAPRDMSERFKDRPPFDRWQPAVLHDYCEYGLLPAPDGNDYVLACPPAIEAAIYAASVNADIYDILPTIDVPVRIIRAGSLQAERTWDMSASATAPDLAAHFKRGEDVYLPQYTHFLPMEQPALIAQHIRDLQNRAGMFAASTGK